MDVFMDKLLLNKVSLVYQNIYGQLVSFFCKWLDNVSDVMDLLYDVFMLWLKWVKQIFVEYLWVFFFKIVYWVLIDYWWVVGKQCMVLV